jgi:hypothetical protein
MGHQGNGVLRVTVMPKRLLWVDGFLCLTVLAVAVVLLVDRLTPRPGVTPENFRRLHLGMSEEEAEVRLGRPADSSLHFSFSHLDQWVENDATINLNVSDLWSSQLGETGPTLQGGNMMLPDGSALDLRDNAGKSPFDKLRELVGLK